VELTLWAVCGSKANCGQGDTFLRSAYVVFDLENEEISLGKAKFNVTESNIEEIPKGKGGIPGATAASSAVTLAPTATGDARDENMPYASGSYTLTAGGFATETPKSGASTPRSNRPGLAISFLIAALPIIVS
jgi:hypothetical protein